MNITSPAMAVGYQFWLPARWALLSMMAMTLIAWVAMTFAPPEASRQALPAIIPLFGTTLVLLIGIFAYGNSDISARESGFPRFMFTFPASSARLAAVPMIYGAAVSAALWVVFAEVPLRTMGLQVPVMWPAAAAATFCVWLQAISWTPFWFRLARVATAAVGLTAVIGAGLVGSTFKASEAALLAMYGVLMIVAFPVAAAGVARARRGDGTVSPWAARSMRVTPPPPPRSPFSSPTRAQLWYDLRRNLIMLPAFSIFMGLLITSVGYLAQRGKGGSLYVQGFEIEGWMMVLAVTLFSPLFSAMFMNGVIGKVDAWLPEITLPSFFAARPITTMHFVIVRLKTAVLAMAMCWAAALLIATVWAFLPRSYDWTHSVAQMIARHVTPRRAAIAVGLLVFTILTSWKIMVESLYIYFYGRKWLTISLPLAYIVLWSAAGLLVPWVFRHPKILAAMTNAIHWALPALVVLKIVLALLVLRALDRLHLLPARRAFILATVWLAVAVLLWLTLLALVPALRVIAAAIGCVLFLYLPAVRLLLAPLALHYNRHR